MPLQTPRPRPLGVLPSLVAALWVVSSPSLFASAAQDRDVLPSRPIVIDAAAELIAVPLELTPEMQRDVEAWQREYVAWRKWAAEWRGRSEPGWFARRDRKPKPDPPDWLVHACSEPLDNLWLAEPCSTVNDWQNDFLANEFRDVQATARAQQEAPSKTQWWEHVHLDAFWPVAQPGGFGLFGTHLTIDVRGRLEVFGAPGFIMLTIPDAGTREWTPAADYGASIRLGTFTLPASTSKATLHLNVARAWLFGAAGATFSRHVDLVGLSLTFPQTHGSSP